jgi:hypothetical protein
MPAIKISDNNSMGAGNNSTLLKFNSFYDKYKVFQNLKNTLLIGA